ncbi:MAG: hypothetical protein QOJ63_703 [Solirubrobacteraceae bacterium]|nr:hypothetical protein [Solirubrobacteraceae bacterium]
MAARLYAAYSSRASSTAPSCPRPGSSRSVARRSQQRRRDVADLERADPHHQPSELAAQDRTHADAQRAALLDARARRAADRVQDRRDREQARNDRQLDRSPHAARGDERERQQRAADGAQVVHRALEAVGAPVRGGRHDVRQQRVARRDAQPARCPRAGAQHPHLPRRGGRADQARQHRGRRVAADGGGLPSLRIVGERAAREARGAGEAVRDTLDDAERRGGCAERARQQARQQRRRDLVAEVGQ